MNDFQTSLILQVISRHEREGNNHGKMTRSNDTEILPHGWRGRRYINSLENAVEDVWRKMHRLTCRLHLTASIKEESIRSMLVEDGVNYEEETYQWRLKMTNRSYVESMINLSYFNSSFNPALDFNHHDRGRDYTIIHEKIIPAPQKTSEAELDTSQAAV